MLLSPQEESIALPAEALLLQLLRWAPLAVQLVATAAAGRPAWLVGTARRRAPLEWGGPRRILDRGSATGTADFDGGDLLGGAAAVAVAQLPARRMRMSLNLRRSGGCPGLLG